MKGDSDEEDEEEAAIEQLKNLDLGMHYSHSSSFLINCCLQIILM